MAGKPTIHYTWQVEKCINFSKSWLEHYHVSKKDIDEIFANIAGFVTKYSKKPPAKMLSKDVKIACYRDAKDFYEKIEKRVRALEQPLTEKRIKKVLHELPDGEDLTDLMLSYRIYDTENRIRVRKPIDTVVKKSDINIKSWYKNE
jgi:hypothetical protein